MLRRLAHHPLKSRSEAIAAVVTELLLLALAGLAGIVVLGVLMSVGVIDPDEHAWAGVAGGPILMATAVATYWGIETVMGRTGADGPAQPLVAKAERMSWSATLGVVVLHVGAAVIGSMVLGVIQELVFAKPVTEQDSIVDLVATGDPAIRCCSACWPWPRSGWPR